MTRVLPARTAYVLKDDRTNRMCIDATLQLGFGVCVTRRLVVQGLQNPITTPVLLEKAMQCLIVLAGGKKLLVETDDDGIDGPIRARLYLNEKVGDPPPECYKKPPGYPHPRLEFGCFWAMIEEHQFDVEFVKSVLNGRNGRTL